MNRINQLTEIHQSGKPYIIYKSQKGFDLYTDFSKKIILNKKNIKSFLNKKNKRNFKDTDLFIGFFGYELLNNLIDKPLIKISLIFTPGVIARAPIAIDSIGGGDLICIPEILSVIQSFINGICVPPPTKITEFKSSTLKNFPLATILRPSVVYSSDDNFSTNFSSLRH